ncbi:MAG: helix-turn-helix domain-containing protein, partial [Geovibrio sp.]|nr:helix-turn-helix domain-containing protein [Geovibrio sp.]
MKQHEIIQYIRKARGLTQRELSEKINVASSVMSRAENSAANKENTEAICRALGINKLKELEFTDEINYFVLPETVNSNIDLAFIYFLAAKKSKVYLLHSDLNLSLKNKKSISVLRGSGLQSIISSSLLVFLREERMPL